MNAKNSSIIFILSIPLSEYSADPDPYPSAILDL
jgi:hypothetical protein